MAVEQVFLCLRRLSQGSQERRLARVGHAEQHDAKGVLCSAGVGHGLLSGSPPLEDDARWGRQGWHLAHTHDSRGRLQKGQGPFASRSNDSISSTTHFALRKLRL